MGIQMMAEFTNEDSGVSFMVTDHGELYLKTPRDEEYQMLPGNIAAHAGERIVKQVSFFMRLKGQAAQARAQATDAGEVVANTPNTHGEPGTAEDTSR